MRSDIFSFDPCILWALGEEFEFFFHEWRFATGPPGFPTVFLFVRWFASI